MQGGRGSGRASTGQVRLWGRHAVEAALKNPARQHRKLWATREGIASLDGELPADFHVEYADVSDLARLVARDAPHQGLVLECAPLEDVFLEEVLDGDPARPLLVLDQVTDPHNVGAILRSAAAFNACGLLTQDRHSPPESGVVAKSASGALEIVPWVRVVNLARALEDAAEAGYWRIGLAGEAKQTLTEALPAGPVALVLGAEGPGMSVEVGWSKNPNTAINWTGGPVSGIIGPDRLTRMRLVAASAPPGLEPSAPPSIRSIPNNHRSYALQWFGFAAIALIIYALAVRKRLKEQP